MRIFVVFMCLVALAAVKSDDAAQAKSDADKAMEDAKIAVDAAKAVNKETGKDAAETAKQAADAAAAAKDEAAEAKEAAKDAAKNAKTDAEKKDADASATAASNAEAAAKVAAAAAEKAAFEQCHPRRKHAVPAYHFIPNSNEPPNEKQIEEEYRKTHDHAVKKALDQAKVLRKNFQAHKKAAEAAGKDTSKHHQRYLRTYDSIKRVSGEICYLFYGFRHLHIPRVRCKPEDAPDCHGKTDKGMKVYVPVKFKEYHLYANCAKKGSHQIKVHVATECACEEHPCRKAGQR